MTAAPSPAAARAALSEARRKRAEWLLAVNDGLFTVDDLIDEATRDEGKALRKITLRQLLLAQDGWGERRTDRLLSVVAATLGIDSKQVRGETVAWLIDPRAGGRRYLAWLDAQQDKTGAPWAGFPFAPQQGVGG